MAKKQITKAHALAYKRACKKKKGEILNWICQCNSWSRDHARKQLLKAACPKLLNKTPRPRKRPLKYSALARNILLNLWVLAGQACGQYLYAQIHSGLIERLILHRELHTQARNKGPLLSPSDPVIQELHSISSSTIDRYLSRAKKDLQPFAISATRQASYALRNEIPFGKSYLDHAEPGWLSTDTVAHCGASLKGDHIWTLNCTDTFSGWTETLSIPSRASRFVREGHEELLPRFPFPIKGINYDGGSEFINREMIDYAALQHYQMTRSRPYHSNDNAHVEQKNADIVRRYAFRYRYNGSEALACLNELWHWVNLRKNYLMPTRKCIGHTKTRSGRTRGIYDLPCPPALRLLRFPALSSKQKKLIEKTLASLNDAEVSRKIFCLQNKLFTLVKDERLRDYIHKAFSSFSSA